MRLIYSAARLLPILLLFGMSTQAPARYRLHDSPFFINDTGARKIEFATQGKQFAFEADTTRLESAFGLRYGLNEHFSFEFTFPFLMETQGNFSKSGQGDLCAAVAYSHDLKAWPVLSLSMRQALIFPSGFKRELAGFDTFTANRSQSETIVQLELGDSAEKKSPLWLAINGGLRTDDHRENTQLLWGTSMRYHLLKRWVFLEGELAQEMATGDKETRYQFSAGAGVRLPFGLLLRAGAEDRVLYSLDRFGLYAGLSWSRQPREPIRIKHRRLQEGLLQMLRDKNRVPGFTLEPGSPSILEESGRLPFLPLRVALIPFAEQRGAPISNSLLEAIRLSMEMDTSFQVIPTEQVERILIRDKLSRGQLEDVDRLTRIGRELKADVVIRGRIVSYEPSLLDGPLLAPLLAKTHQESRLEAQVWMHLLDQPGPPQMETVDALAAGPSRLSLFTASHGHREQAKSALERSALTRSVIDRWCAEARERLFYETTEQLVVE